MFGGRGHESAWFYSWSTRWGIPSMGQVEFTLPCGKMLKTLKLGAPSKNWAQSQLSSRKMSITIQGEHHILVLIADFFMAVYLWYALEFSATSLLFQRLSAVHYAIPDWNYDRQVQQPEFKFSSIVMSNEIIKFLNRELTITGVFCVWYWFCVGV